MPKLLHEQTGLKIVQNEKNGFTVCTLHYTADPRKRSPEWREAAKKGMKPAQYDQEFEIVYDSYMGAKVFPEIKERRSDIIVHEGPYEFNEWPKGLAMWAGLDWGTNNPACFTVYTIVDGITYALWELYKPVKNLFDFIAEMKECPYWDQIKYIAHDPDMRNFKQRDMETGMMTTVAMQLVKLGITRLLPGNTDEQGWLVKMQQHWSGQDVTFKILDRCVNLIDEFESATYVSMTEKQLETQNYKEAMVDKHNHALDACKYFMNSCASEKVNRPLRFRSLVDTYGWSATQPKVVGRERELGLRI